MASGTAATGTNATARRATNRTTDPEGGAKRLKIVMVATEAVPFAKEGGVADVMGSLPKELAALGHEVCLFLPRYGSIDPERWGLESIGLVSTLPVAGSHYAVAGLPGAPPAS